MYTQERQAFDHMIKEAKAKIDKHVIEVREKDVDPMLVAVNVALDKVAHIERKLGGMEMSLNEAEAKIRKLSSSK